MGRTPQPSSHILKELIWQHTHCACTHAAEQVVNLPEWRWWFYSFPVESSCWIRLKVPEISANWCHQNIPECVCVDSGWFTVAASWIQMIYLPPDPHTADIVVALRLRPCVYQRTPRWHRPLETSASLLRSKWMMMTSDWANHLQRYSARRRVALIHIPQAIPSFLPQHCHDHTPASSGD